MASLAHLMFAVTSVKEDWHLDWSESKVTSQTVRHCARVTANPLLQDTITIAEAAMPAVTYRRFQSIAFFPYWKCEWLRPSRGLPVMPRGYVTRTGVLHHFILAKWLSPRY